RTRRTLKIASLRLRTNAPTALGAYALAGGVVSLAGWVLDLPRLTAWFGGGISIQPNATLAAIAAGAALILLARGHRRTATVLAWLVTTIGATVVFEYISGVDL